MIPAFFIPNRALSRVRLSFSSRFNVQGFGNRDIRFDALNPFVKLRADLNIEPSTPRSIFAARGKTQEFEEGK
jgi:hypothetical protein